MIVEMITVGRFQENCYVIGDEESGTGALIDPGDAPGHLAFYAEEGGIVFSGDALFAGSIGRTDLPGGSMDVLMRSISEKILTLPDETRVLSGHGPETTIGQERRYNPFLRGGGLL